jgi:hypothetical protein
MNKKSHTIFVQRFLFALSCFGISLQSFSQDKGDLSTYPGKWIYTNNNLSGEWFGERHYKMNASELEKYHATTEKLVNYLRQQPVAQNPLGVVLNAQSRCAYNQYDHDRLSAANERVKAEIYIPFCNFYEKNGKVNYACTEVSNIKLRTNDITTAFESMMNDNTVLNNKALKEYHDLFFRPNKLMNLGSGVFLYDGYYTNYIIVSGNERPLWSPITNREYTQRMLAYFVALYKQPDNLQQMTIDALKSEIAAIPPEMMSQPSYINGNPERPLTGICSMEEDSTKALYKINPNYFDPSLPRTAVQLITISIEGHADDADWGGINAHRVWEFLQGMKGSDLRKLLDIE